MKKILLFILLLLLPTCKVQKHIESDKQTKIENKVDIVEKTDKNTTKYITIYEYETVYDTIRNEYPIKKKTDIKEVNNDKVVTESKTETNEEIKEQVKEDNKTESSIKWYIVCFVAGIVVTLIVILFIKLLILYIKKGV